MHQMSSSIQKLLEYLDEKSVSYNFDASLAVTGTLDEITDLRLLPFDRKELVEDGSCLIRVATERLNELSDALQETNFIQASLDEENNCLSFLVYSHQVEAVEKEDESESSFGTESGDEDDSSESSFDISSSDEEET